MRDKYDAIIIGAGLGGLVCGSYLAKQGMKVLAIEQHSIPGGFCTSYQKNDCTFDVPVVMTNMGTGSRDREILSYIGLEDDIEYIQLEKLAKVIGPDISLEWPTKLSELKKEFIKKFPEEEKNIQDYFNEISMIYDEILTAHYKPNLWQKLIYPIKFPRLVKYRKDNLDRFLSRFTSNKKLKDLLGTEAITLGLSNKTISALVYVGMIMAYAKGGIWYPKGGFQLISDKISEKFQALGGELKLKTKVDKVIVKDKKAIGVELSSNVKIYADYVISNADTKKTFLELIDRQHIDSKTYSKVNNSQQSFSGFVVKLAVKMDLSSFEGLGWILYFPEFGSTEKMLNQAKNHDFDIENCSFSIDTAALADKTNTADGIARIGLVALPAPYSFRDKWHHSDPKKYQQLKEEFSNILIKRAEQIIPGLSENIIVKDISTPRTYQRYTFAEQGGWYDLAMNVENSLENRMGPNTFIKGFYLTGSKSITGPGLNTAIFSGLFTADSILKGKLTGGKCFLSADLVK